MWWKLKEVHTHVEVHLFFIVDVQLFVGVDRHQQSANVGLKQKGKEYRYFKLLTSSRIQASSPPNSRR